MNKMYQIITEYKPGIEPILIVESGARAWGWDSEKSDQDVRFIYGYKSIGDYVQLGKPRDSIDFNFGDLDFHGWSLKKALKLAMSSNANLREWSMSPIHYYCTPLSNRLESYIYDNYSNIRVAHNYRGIAKAVYHQYLKDKEEVQVKKLLYAIRGILCIMYIDDKWALPPISFKDDLVPSLCDHVSDDYIEGVLNLIKRKKTEGNPVLRGEEKDKWVLRVEKGIDTYTPNYIDEKFPNTPPDVSELNSIYRDWVLSLF